MTKVAFVTKKFAPHVVHTIEAANGILREYARRGLPMTLRQLHYQFVARGIIERDKEGNEKVYANTVQNYKRLGEYMSNGRLAGLVDWAHMEDRLRELDRSPRWDSPSQIIEAVADQYQQDLWAGQKVRPELWVEKDALSGVFDRICKELRVDMFACRGYVSQSAQFDAAKRFQRYRDLGQEPIVFHFGDHDPSGLDMTRENEEKFFLLTGRRVKVVRLALNMDQVEEYNPPPNPTKLTDSRANPYIDRFGPESWELDALDPDVLIALARNAIEPLINTRLWNDAERDEAKRKDELRDLSNQDWDSVVELIRNQ